MRNHLEWVIVTFSCDLVTFDSLFVMVASDRIDSAEFALASSRSKGLLTSEADVSSVKEVMLLNR